MGNLLQEAIAEAKTLREAAIVNAYKQLEENVTPAIKEALAQKLQEDEEIEDETEEMENIDETRNSGFKEVKSKKARIEEEEETETEETETEDESEEEETGEEEETPEEEEIADDTPLEDVTVGDIKDILKDLIAQMSAEPAPEGEFGADMEAADVEGAGEEEVPLTGAEEEEEFEDSGDEEDVDDTEEEIDLSELLKELEQEERDRKVTTRLQGKEHCSTCNEEKVKKLKRENTELKKELRESKQALGEVTDTLADVNLLNAKLNYTTRTLAKPLTESQKLRVLKAFDAATSTKEIKLIYKTLNESLDAEIARPSKKATVLKEHKGSASRVIGGATAPKGIVETDPVVKRFQQLAGIIE